MKRTLFSALVAFLLLATLTPASAAEAEPYAQYDYIAVLGDYRFELDGKEVYLMRPDWGELGVLLPHMGQALREKWLSPGQIRADWGSDDTVIVEIWDIFGEEERSVSMNYPISSLDWCLENLSTNCREPEESLSGAGVQLGLRKLTYSSLTESLLLHRVEENGRWVWQEVPQVPWGKEVRLISFTGEYFFVQDCRSCQVYASRDGLEWREVEALFPAEDWFDHMTCAFADTEEGYLACRKAWESRYGMMGMAGGRWCEGNTCVYFLDRELSLTQVHDFGRLVEAVGCLDGAYYARVGNSEERVENWGGEIGFDSTLGSTLYRSTDGVNWEALPDTYLELEGKLTAAGGEAEEVDRWGVADVRLAEGVLSYRSAETGGEWTALKEVPWGAEAILLPDTGRDFVMMDHSDGRFYFSADGLTWREPTGEWYRALQERCFIDWSSYLGGNVRYEGLSAEQLEGKTGCKDLQVALLWVGDRYMAVYRALEPTTTLVAGEGQETVKVYWGGYKDRDMGQVWFLDEDLNEISSCPFDTLLNGVGYADGVCYVEVGDLSWDGDGFRVGGTGLEGVYRSADGVSWEKTDLLIVQNRLQYNK